MDKDKVFMNIANEISKLSHCVSFKVGAILVKDSRSFVKIMIMNENV